ncbi:hypothetical protein PBAC_17120 [Pedobacter glucosidilyticus]|nr:glycosyltransferase [Pedobacter glucosidilyticus]KHJ38171.1 hypothetical protein PBAC_17120 [Pedobacter glucosidilyticus]
MSNTLAPIVLFTYKRLETLQKTIDALKLNFLAADSDLIIYSDGAKHDKDESIINGIRTYLKTITGFKSIAIYESEKNQGLATSIISGVSAVMKVYDKAIVLEDDLLTSTNFLSFMNQALDKYKHSAKVCSISAYSFDLKEQDDSLEEGYFLNRSWSWGWATWRDRWAEVDWTVSDYKEFSKSNTQKAGFAKLGSDVNKMLAAQMTGKADSWYIRFVYHQYKKGLITFYPLVSKIDNNGFDTEATHNTGIKSRFITSFDLTNNIEFTFPENVIIDEAKQRVFSEKLGFKTRLINKIKEFFLK